MKVCYFGTYERNYPRNKIIIDGLRKNDVEVVECHFPLWELTRDKTGDYLGLRSIVALIAKVGLGYLKLIKRYFLNIGDYDVMMVGYIGQLDIFLAKILTIFPKRRRLIFNPSISLYDTLITDRKLFRENSIISKIFFLLDKWSFKLSGLIILDTYAHIDYISERFNIDKGKFRKVSVGADEEYFYPISKEGDEDKFVVLFIGKFIPLHGIPHIIKAAKLLEDEPDVKFEIVGSGQLYGEIMSLCNELAVKNIEFTDWIEYEKLSEKMAEADVCLGIFGNGVKAKMVVPNKVFQALAMGKPVITGDSMAARELLVGGENAILCEMGNPEAIRDMILLLKEDIKLWEKVAEHGSLLFKERLSPMALGGKVKAICDELLRGQL